MLRSYFIVLKIVENVIHSRIPDSVSACFRYEFKEFDRMNHCNTLVLITRMKRKFPSVIISILETWFININTCVSCNNTRFSLLLDYILALGKEVCDCLYYSLFSLMTFKSIAAAGCMYLSVTRYCIFLYAVCSYHTLFSEPQLLLNVGEKEQMI